MHIFEYFVHNWYNYLGKIRRSDPVGGGMPLRAGIGFQNTHVSLSVLFLSHGCGSSCNLSAVSLFRCHKL